MSPSSRPARRFSFATLRRATVADTAWPHLMLAGGCTLVLALLIASTWQSSLGLDTLSALHTQGERAKRLDRLKLQLVDAETGVRGYLLTGETLYLEPYERTAAAIDDSVATLVADFSHTPHEGETVAALRQLVGLKMTAMSVAVARRTLTDEKLDDLVGKQLMDEIRAAIDGLAERLHERDRASLAQSMRRFEQTRLAVIALATAALVLLLVLFSSALRQLQLRAELAQLLRTENVRLDALVQTRTAELSRLASYLTNTREAEKARLARELHDELGALLTAAKMDAGAVVRKLAAQAPAALAALRPNLDRLVDTLTRGIALKRRIIDDLRPPLLQDLGLVAALRALTGEFNAAGDYRLDLELPDTEPALSPERALALFRIAQEALTNIRKHAHARTVKLALEIDAEGATLRIDDDGAGFDAAAAGSASHGLAGMRHRVQMFAGRLDVASAPGTGTRISARIARAAD
jgi:protein-histidine pros-kinase